MFVDKKPSKYSFPRLTAGWNICFGAIGEANIRKKGAKGSTVGSLPSTTTESLVEVFPNPSKIIFCQVKTTSSAVIGLPSDHFTPWRSFTTYSFPFTENDFASFGIVSPVTGLVVTNPSYIISDIWAEILSFVLNGLKVFGPSPIVEETKVPPYFPIGVCDCK